MLARPGLPSFEYVRAVTPDQVVGLLQEPGRTVRLLMGGTDLFPRLRDGLPCPDLVVDVKALPGLTGIRYDDRAGLEVGAAATLNALSRHADLVAHYPLLVEAANSVASYQVRNRATLGGNLCNASPAADTAPAVLVLEGRLVLRGPSGEREVPAGEFFFGPGRTAMQPGEFMTAVRFPVPAGLASADGAGTYLKLGRNRGGDLAIAGVAVYGFSDRSTPSGFRFRIALASVAPTPLRAVAAEAVLAAQPLGATVFGHAAETAAAATSPIDDVRASATYRRAMVRTLTLRGLQQVWHTLSGSGGGPVQP